MCLKLPPCPVAQALIREAPAAGSMTGRQLLEALARGTEMHKAWEGGSGGSRRLVQVQCRRMLSCGAPFHDRGGLLWALRGTAPGNKLHQHGAPRLWTRTTPSRRHNQRRWWSLCCRA